MKLFRTLLLALALVPALLRAQAAHNYVLYDVNAGVTALEPNWFGDSTLATDCFLFHTASGPIQATMGVGFIRTGNTIEIDPDVLPLDRSFNNTPTKTLVTSPTGQGGVVLDAARDVQVSYFVDTSITTSIGGTSSLTLFLEIADTNSVTAGNWTAIDKSSNGNTITLAIALQSIQPQTLKLNGTIPAGKYVRIRSAGAGTSSATYGGGQEVKL